jgi:hypothetical protein
MAASRLTGLTKLNGTAIAVSYKCSAAGAHQIKLFFDFGYPSFGGADTQLCTGCAAASSLSTVSIELREKALSQAVTSLSAPGFIDHLKLFASCNVVTLIGNHVHKRAA